MELKRVSGGGPDCRSGDCPAVYTTDRAAVLAVQGQLLPHSAPDGEAIVSIPESVLREAVRALGW
ncbi:hypothetical protein ACFVIM_11060 [Streptomyces sp. NPDC057638]|uniref:hypothetical protein n=1 Tax=Streptomyces sp. NPDC057638 TaxID=3346190 RepID=UPI0036838B11